MNDGRRRADESTRRLHMQDPLPASDAARDQGLMRTALPRTVDVWFFQRK